MSRIPSTILITTVIGAAAIVACGTLLNLNDDEGRSDPDAQTQTSDSGPAANETGGDVLRSEDVGAEPVPTCGTMMTDGFEGGSWIADWNEVISPSPTHITIDTSRFHAGASSVRFKTNVFSDVTRLARALSGSCKLRITAWFFVTAASGKDGSGLFELGRAGNHVTRISLIANTLRVQDDNDNGLATPTFDADTWTPLAIDLDPMTGGLVVGLGNHPPSKRQVAPGSPTFVRMGIMGANDGAQGPDEVLFDDVVISH